MNYGKDNSFIDIYTLISDIRYISRNCLIDRIECISIEYDKKANDNTYTLYFKLSIRDENGVIEEPYAFLDTKYNKVNSQIDNLIKLIKSHNRYIKKIIKKNIKVNKVISRINKKLRMV